PQMEGDARQLQQLFQNLIGNALKYRNTTVHTEVQVTGRLLSPSDPMPVEAGLPEGKWYLVEVRDNGIGFDMHYSSKIFQVFQRLHGRAEYEGSGIGLAIVQKVATRHGGMVRALSEPGNGATFQVLLPVDFLNIKIPVPSNQS
ncbi:MAG: ATP-binding protein, partial [Sphingobacteriales bacterium]